MMINFKINDYCVYRTHGVAKITDIQSVKIGKDDTKCLVLYFEREKLTLLVPFQNESKDIRKISTPADIDKVVAILRGSARKAKSMWSKRAKEYKDRISSGDIFQTAEVLRDLMRGIDEVDRSFSERNIYDLAVYRIASEYAIVKKMSYEEAEKRIYGIAKDKTKSADD